MVERSAPKKKSGRGREITLNGAASIHYRQQGKEDSASGFNGQAPEKVVCVHHWDIESPNGRTSIGVCKGCKTERKFSNSTGYVSPSEWPSNVGGTTNVSLERNNIVPHNTRADRTDLDRRLRFDE